MGGRSALDGQNDDRGWDELTPNELDDLYDISDIYYTYAGMYAMNILNEYDNAGFYIPPATDDDSWTPRSVSSNRIAESNPLNVYPNPADRLITIQLNLAKPVNAPCALTIYDMNGQIIAQRTVYFTNEQLVFNTRSWTNGQYVYQVVTPGSEKLSGVFEIIH